jgi:nucleoid-associated protein YgaU
MGVFDFIKSAGEKVVGMVGGGPAASMLEYLKSKGLPAEQVQVEYDPASGQVKLDGRTATQAEREKIRVALGNVAGVEKVEDNLETDDNADESRFYTVKSGDTLGKIAKEMYGNAGKYPLIFEANKPMLSDPDKIYPGQVLRIPALPD